MTGQEELHEGFEIRDLGITELRFVSEFAQSMASARLRVLDEETEAQIAADLEIVWETPSTPAHPHDYIILHGTRMVRPYFFEFIAHVKRRWAGKTVVDLFAQEFRQRPREYYVQAVERGRIRVEGKLVAPSYVVKDSQVMSHFVHRHEPPVMAESVTVLEEDSDVITVCKPASVPVHPCGQYRKNTVMGILVAERNTGPLFPVHRLDRLVSGLLILARNSRTADFFRQEIEAGVVQKQYVAKVKGIFPAEEVEVNATVTYDHKEGRSTVEAPAKGAGREEKLESQAAPEKDAKGKEACTKFQRVSTDGVYSVVRCMPQTGRTHQIRVHLQYLGHPIGNDALYLQSNVAKRSKMNTSADLAAHLVSMTAEIPGKVDDRVRPDSSTVGSGEAREEARSLLQNTGDCKQSPSTVEFRLISKPTHQSHYQSLNRSAKDAYKQFDRSIDRSECDSLNTAQASHQSPQGNAVSQTGKSDIQLEELGTNCLNHLQAETTSIKADFQVDPLCTHCPNLEPSGYTGDEDGLWLHCVRYSGNSWAYECPLPRWAL